MSEEMIEPCPFCGNPPEDCPQNSERRHPTRKDEWCVYIWCDNCDARGPEKREADEAIAAWNTRAYNPNERLTARVAELEAALLPFAEYAGCCLSGQETVGIRNIPCEYLRAARAALSPLPQGEDT